MPEQALAPIPGAGVPVAPNRFIPPLPEGIPILPGRVKIPRAKRRLSRRFIVIALLVIWGVAGQIYSRYHRTGDSPKTSHSESSLGAERRKPLVPTHAAVTNRAIEARRLADDGKRISAVMTAALRARSPKGTRVPVTLSGGPRLLQLGIASVFYTGKNPRTCGTATVLDPKTGLKDSRYQSGVSTCVDGLNYWIF